MTITACPKAMRLIAIESPFAGQVSENIAYARRCVVDCLRRGESAYASHLFFTQDGILDDLQPEERKLGINAGFAWSAKAGVVALYVDRGISNGMRAGIKRAVDAGQRIEVRSLEREVSREEGLAIVQEALRG